MSIHTEQDFLEQRLIQLLLEHESLLDELRLVRSLRLPQCYVAAGYIRNYVWDRICGYSSRSLHDDIDLVYFDSNDLSPGRDHELEEYLITATGNPQWSVKNQARMHTRNGDPIPYQSTADALSRWPEMVTAVGVRLNDEDQLELCCPHGLADLFQMRVQRSPYFLDHGYYLERIAKKGWEQNWPNLTVIS
ncbi:nucleotidyltransferase family protein [Paenibacillus albus]|uniref:Nucleotidyltransferase family protein n=1 Tax=Paenibacillus albus TaxID=2495582 RepID=A0A3Q8X989_9BACL|nr:nucleotidyltransferase family protein [Paenibacillus albus]AZN42210.1 nucleotidyltransferase family protein [Paenibacillus albus]